MRYAARPPTICAPDAYSSDRSRCLSAAPRPRWRGRRVLLRRLPLRPDRRGREGQRGPDRRDDAGAGGEEALRDAARPARPPGQGPLQGPHLHALAEGGVDRDRHPRLRGQGAQALPGGGHVHPHLAQRAQQVAGHRAGGRGLLQPAGDPQARQARAEVDRQQAGRREGRPVEGLRRRVGLQDRRARQVQLAGQGRRADAAGPGQHRDGQGQDDRRAAQDLDQGPGQEVSGGPDRRPPVLQARRSTRTSSSRRPTGSPSARSAWTRRPGSTTSRTRP